MKKIKNFCVLILICSSIQLIGQVTSNNDQYVDQSLEVNKSNFNERNEFQSWQNIVAENDNYSEAITEVEKLHDRIGRGKGSGYKQFCRWKSNMDARVGNSNSMFNYSYLNKVAYQRAKKNAPPTNNRSTYGSWTNIGPFDYNVSDAWSGGGIGRITCTAFHPSNSNIFWVGSAAGGLWKTTDNGNSWFPMTDAFASIGISGIVVNKLNPDTIHILTGDGRASDSPSIGVLKTTNGGVSWDTTALTFGSLETEFGFTVVGHPSNSNVLFVGMRQLGLYKSADAGNTFTQVIGGISDTTVWDVEFIPGNPQWMLAGSNAGLMRSLDGGDTWFLDNDTIFPSSFARLEIAISASAPQNVYVIYNGTTGVNGTFQGCFKSTDYGASFSMQSNSPNVFGRDLAGNDSVDQGARDLGFVVDPTNDLRLFAGGVVIWKSEDGGVTWGRETWWTRNFASSDPYVHADQQNFYWKDTDTLLVNNDGGIFYTADYGHSWTELSSGLAVGQFYEIDVHNNEYIGGMQDNGTMEEEFTNPQSHQILGGDGFGCTWHTGDHSIKYLSTQSSIQRRQLGSNIIIWDGFGGLAFWETEIEMHTTNPDYFFLDRGNKLFRSHNELFVWNFIWEDLGTDTILSTDQIRGFAQCSVNPEVMYVVNLNGIIKTTNLSASIPLWSTISNPFMGSAQIYDVTVDPNNENRVWIIGNSYEAGQKVYYSNNGGMIWTNISGSIENVPMRTVLYHSGTNPGLYVGTEIGMYYLGDALSDWISFANYLPNTVVTDIEIEGGFITVGTHGRGIWRSELYSTCQTDLVLTPANDPSNPLSIGEQHYSASNSITSTRELQGGFAQITYSAGNFIDMKPGFLAEKNNFIIAKPDGCPD